MVATLDNVEPTSFTSANRHPQWCQAMDSELTALLKNQTWTLVPYHPSMNIKQLDVQNAFLHGLPNEEVFMSQSLGFTDTAHPNHVCRLNKSIYGLKQALQAWFERLSSFLLEVGFEGNDTALVSRFIQQIAECKSVSTLISSTARLTMTSGNLMEDLTVYRSTVGALQYATLTRPNIQFAVNKVCQYMHRPTVDHWAVVKRILRYLKGTINNGLALDRTTSMTLSAFSDADWAGCVNDRKSTGGFAIYLGSNLISWSSRKQATVARSSTESEYRALANAAIELTWLQSLLKKLHIYLPRAPIL
ncbi:uncharacterized mitochondrial protein AtMg00810-like [Telopea speciosissima]|uniref:uncharacterized mitochondrial protein AtMg00810-like n=1 Tax=Telopea speciosissima TaxID=54955 RepID=UPI001CC7C523|nr:uncharacterized mitochondrial protein AtMg00810-like [Telopea speciosissima]